MGRGRWVLPAAAAVVAAAVYGVYLYRALPPPAGDEPHYVLAARSLVEDHDVDLRNDYADVRRWGPVYPAHDRLDHSVAAFDYRGDGTLRSVHNVGLSVLLAPSQALHPGHRSAQAAMALMSVGLAAALLVLLLRLWPDRPVLVVLVWAGFVFTLPLLGFATQVYPEVPAALALVLAALCIRRPVVVGVLAATLPWLHIRYAPLALTVLAVALLRASTNRDRLLALAPFAAGMALLATAFQHWYGSPLPGAPYTAPPFAHRGTGLVGLYHFGLGGFLDTAAGLLPYSPVLLVGLVGAGPLVRRFGRTARAALAGALLYAGTAAMAGGAAYSLPGRFLVPLVPLLALPAAAAVTRFRSAGALFAGLAAVSLALAAPTAARFGDLYDIGYPHYRPVMETAGLWPVFAAENGVEHFDAPAVSDLLQLRPGHWEITAGAGPVAVEDVILGRTRARTPDARLAYRSPDARLVRVRAAGGPVHGLRLRLLDHPRTLSTDGPKSLAWLAALGLLAAWFSRPTRPGASGSAGSAATPAAAPAGPPEEPSTTAGRAAPPT